MQYSPCVNIMQINALYLHWNENISVMKIKNTPQRQVSAHKTPMHWQLD